MKTAVCPGSFDPFTKGHLDIVKTASRLFDKVIVAVMVNPDKVYLFTEEERVEMIKAAVSEEKLENVEVLFDNGLLADFAKKHNACAIVKGIRSKEDFEYEKEMAQINKKLNDKAVTVLICANSEYENISSSSVKKMLLANEDISKYVPKSILKIINKKEK